jgi:class 3 adenylate cyclase/tetratricopeptide (TPR) repeat protein
VQAGTTIGPALRVSLRPEREAKLQQPGAPMGAVLARYVPRHVLAAGPCESPSAREFDGVALMLDIAGFTSLTEAFAREGAAGAERLSAILDRYFGCMTGIAVAHGGDVLDIVGDAVLVGWECTAPPGETALLAVQCGLALQNALPEIVAGTGAQLRQRVSLARGRLTHFIVGGIGGKWHSLTAGAPLTEAAAANQQGGAGDAVVCASLWEEVRKHCDARALAGGAAAVTRVRNPLPLPSTPDLEGASPPSVVERFLAQPLLDRLRMGGGRWLGEFRNLTLLFIGVPGVDCARPGALADLQAALECAQRTHGRLGGVLTRLSSDDKGVTLLCAFGLPLTAREDDAVRAVAAAQTLADEMRQRGIAVGIGMTTGLVLYADSGGSERRHAGLTGGAVNLAARLMVAAQGGVLCDEATRDAAAPGFLFEPREPVAAKGLAAPIAVWQPQGRAAGARRDFGGTSVGREAEFTRLSPALDALAAGRGGAIALRGEAGIGKSRLIADMAARARERGIAVAWGAGLALEVASVYFPWRQMLAQLLCGRSELDAALGRSVAAGLVADDERLASWLPLLNDVLPMNFRDNEVAQEMAGQARAASLRTLVVELAARSARAQPVLLIADDLHWFDGASAELLLALAAARAPGLLVLAGTRPLDDGAAAAARGLLDETELIDVEALTPAAVGRLIATRLGAAEASPGLLDFVAARTAGNPFYAEEVVLALRASGHIEVSDEVAGFSASARGEALAALPGGLRGIIVSRIDALGAAEQLALRIAAVIGREFSLAMLRDLLPPTEAALDLASVARVLEREDVVRPARAPGGGYRFKHALLQDTVYEQLPFALRQELHGAVAGWIEHNEANDLEPRYAALALHWERALNIPFAVNYLEKSAALSLQRYANREAIAQAERALALTETHKLPRNAARKMRCEAILGDAYDELFEYRAAKRHYKRALARAGRPAPRHTVTLLLDLVWQLAVQLAARAGLARRRSADPLLPWASHVHEKLGEIAYFNSGTLPLLHATLTSLNLAERSGTVREAVYGYGALAIGFYGAGQHWLSRVYNRRSLALAEEKGGIADIAYAHVVSGVYWAAQGHWAEAGQSLEHSAALYMRLGAAERWQQAYGGLCAIELMRGRFDRAQEWLDKLRPVRRETPVQIAAYVHGFDACLALARGGPLAALVERLREVTAARELAQFDRVFCQGLIAAACWRMNDRANAVEVARAGLQSLSAGAPAAWYVTDGIAGIAQTLIDASACGMADVRDARLACRALTRYARATRVAAPRAALLAGRLAAAAGDARRVIAHWRKGLEVARALGTGYDEALLSHALASRSPQETG